MTTKTRQLNYWGNSLSIRIPRDIIRLLDLEEKNFVDMEVVNGRLVISKAVNQEHKPSSERMKDFKEITVGKSRASEVF